MDRSRLLPGKAVRAGLVAASFAIVLLFAALVLLSMRAEREALAGVETHHRVIETSERAISRMAEAEMAQRDFLLTGDSAFDVEYQQSVRRLKADLLAMRHVGRDVDDTIAARRLERTIESRLERLELSMHLRRRVGIAEATRAVDPASGTTEIDGLRALARARVASEEGELTAQAALLRNRSTVVLWILFGGSALAVLLAAGLAMILGAYARERRDTAAALERSNGQLRDKASELELRQADLQRASEELRHSEERLRALVESTTDIISVVDARGRIHYESPSAAATLGWGGQGRHGDDFFDHVHPEDRAEARAAFEHLLESGAPLPISAQMRVRHREGGWRWLSVRGQNLLGHPAVGGVVLTGHDITESRLLEEQFRQAQKLEAVGRMASGIAHDFNNLITTMQGYLSLAVDELEAGSPVRSDLDEVRRATEHATLLTQQLLAFSRKEVVQPTVLQPNAVVAETMRLLQRVLGEDVRVDTILDPDLARVVADRTQLQQVMMNLVVNARDAMPGGGTLRVETRNVEITTDDASAALPAGSYVLLSVGDTGHGMDEATRERIFEPFFTTKDVGKGTGLGLSTVYGIVARHEGHIRLDSEPGRGTTFEIHLPRATEQPAAAGAGRPGEVLGSGSRPGRPERKRSA